MSQRNSWIPAIGQKRWMKRYVVDLNRCGTNGIQHSRVTHNDPRNLHRLMMQTIDSETRARALGWHPAAFGGWVKHCPDEHPTDAGETLFEDDAMQACIAEDRMAEEAKALQSTQPHQTRQQ